MNWIIRTRIFIAAVGATILLVCTRLSAQEAPRVIIGNTDGSPVNVTAQCDVTLPLWIDLPGWVNYGLISLLGNHLIITQWINAEILYPWEYITRIDGDLISLSFRPCTIRSLVLNGCRLAFPIN